ncbi:hypothetical protein TrST_g3528 [Triparma strigata]|uniref:Histone-lysine N-methyltransferase n=1 Tax=Triparma strigata TaxID=1606541 RepID=A0A9W7BKN3_9STRA|nr:hypothetical protein TrST_g3528 [Triparma strigata]
MSITEYAHCRIKKPASDTLHYCSICRKSVHTSCWHELKHSRSETQAELPLPPSTSKTSLAPGTLVLAKYEGDEFRGKVVSYKKEFDEYVIYFFIDKSSCYISASDVSDVLEAEPKKKKPKGSPRMKEKQVQEEKETEGLPLEPMTECAFCYWCVACSKFIPDSSLLCDGCDSEFHISAECSGCEQVPLGAFYCGACRTSAADPPPAVKSYRKILDIGGGTRLFTYDSRPPSHFMKMLHSYKHIDKSQNRRMLTTESAILPNLTTDVYPGTTNSGRLPPEVFDSNIAVGYREMRSLFENRKKKLALSGDAKIFGCGKCRWRKGGCGRCRDPSFVLGDKEGFMGGLVRPGLESSLCDIGALGDVACQRRKFHVTTDCKTHRNLVKAGVPGGEDCLGILADENILPGEFIAEYCGEIFTDEQMTLRESWYANSPQHTVNSYAIFYQGVAVDAQLFGSAARFANHSCDPSGEFQLMFPKKKGLRGMAGLDGLRIGIFATRIIAKGEEITVSYSDEGLSQVVCHCGADECIGFL